MTAPNEFTDKDDRARATSVWGLVFLGIFLVVQEHLVVGGLLGGLGWLADLAGVVRYDNGLMPFFVWLFGIGLAQLVYVVPTFLVALIVRRPVAAGVALGALMTFLLNGACFGALCSSAL